MKGYGSGCARPGWSGRPRCCGGGSSWWRWRRWRSGTASHRPHVSDAELERGFAENPSYRSEIAPLVASREFERFDRLQGERLRAVAADWRANGAPADRWIWLGLRIVGGALFGLLFPGLLLLRRARRPLAVTLSATHVTIEAG